jgi:hypothetical protein
MTRCADRPPISRGRGGPAADRGQVSVEFLGTVPLILLTLVLLWQFVLVGYTFTLVGNAADEGAREASLAETWNRQERCAKAAKDDLPQAWKQSAEVACDPAGERRAGMVKARVDLRVPVLFPGFLDFPFTITGEAGVAAEGR